MKLIIFAFFVCICLSLTFADNLRSIAADSSSLNVISANGLLDSEVKAVAMSSTGKIQYASSYKSYLYKSSDFGETWQAITDVIDVRNIATTPSGKIVFVTQRTRSNYVGILKSTDFGETWSLCYETVYYDPGAALPIAVSSTGQHVYFSTFRFFVSNDYGESFAFIKYSIDEDEVYPYANSISISRTGRYAYFIDENGFYGRSTDYGNKFELFPKNIFGTYVSAAGCSESGKIVYVITSTVTTYDNTYNIFKSNNYGKTFTKISEVTPSIANNVWPFTSVATSKNGDIVYIARLHGPIYRSTDSALSFVELESTALSSSDFYSLISTNYKGDYLLIGNFAGIN